MALQVDATGLQPELALVLITAGPVENFLRAVRRIQGLEWLGESEFERPVDQRFFNEKKPGKPLSGHLYLLMSDQAALRQMLSLWNKGEYTRGLTPWRHAFEHLDEIRPWGPEDRLREVLGGWHQRAAEAGPDERVRCEIELFFRHQPAQRARAETLLARAVEAVAGNVVATCTLAPIHYHGALIDLPIQAIRDIVNQREVQLVRCEEIMFFRPRAQVVAPRGQRDDPLRAADLPRLDLSRDVPRVALLDSLPIKHSLLDGGLIIDDPDHWDQDVLAEHREHGTQMASLILRGDLNRSESALDMPLYLRPILRSIETDGHIEVTTPPDQLLVDFLHAAVNRMVGNTDQPGVAPMVRVVNLSLGDHHRLFDGGLVSPWARLLDWLAWRHGLLFVVSAGNHDLEIQQPLADRDRFRSDSAQREEVVLRHLEDTHAWRRLRIPAEAINALTVGAAHEDGADWSPAPPDRRVDPLSSPDLASPVSAQGPGVRRSIKPDLLAPGGRVLLDDPGPSWRHRIVPTRPPGLKVATVGREGDLDRIAWCCGTSAATALTTRAAGRLIHLLDELRADHGPGRLPETLSGVLLKALLVHGCGWRMGDQLLNTLGGDGNEKRHRAGRFLGNGHLDLDRVLTCTERRATLLATGFIRPEEGHRYEVPLPSALSGKRGLRRLVVTLAWFSPINPASRLYRAANLWFDAGNGAETLRIKRDAANHHAVQRGTVQHEILEGEQAAAFREDEKIVIPVSCMADAGPVEEPVPYALAVTLEVGEEIEVAVYEAIRAAIQVPIAPVRT